MSHREIVNCRIKRRNDKLDRHILTDIAVKEIEQAAIEAHVNSLTHLSIENQNILTKHLNQLIVNNKKYNLTNVQNFNSLDSIEMDPRVEYAQFLFNSILDCSNKDDYLRYVNEINTLYIPGFVDKQNEIEIDNNDSKNSDKILKELEQVDYPISAPQKENINTNEYIKEKEQAIVNMVNKLDHLNNRQKNKLRNLLLKYADRFSLRGENMEKTDTIMHEIDTGAAKPFRERLRNYSPSVQAIIDEEVKKMLNEGIIQPSKSPYASNLLLVRKPDPSSAGGVKNRVCASFVQLNKQTIKDSYPLPNIQTIFDRIGRSKWFTTMDLLNGFWQVIIKPEHRYKTAFITSRGLFEFVVMAFGLCNAPATFQRLMDTVIKPEYRDFIETYIDDVITHSKSFEDHINHLDILLSTLQQHNLVVKLTKCKFAQLEVKFLGHLIAQGLLKPNPEAVDTILKWVRPTQGSNKVRAVRGFLGMVGWFRKFIPHFATIAKPLYNLTKKDVKWDWTDDCEQAFKVLRDALVTKPVLKVADPNKRYVLHTDASDYAFGAILMQEDEDEELHPVSYASVTLSSAEQKYSVTEREAMAIPWALEHFNTYCEGHKYTAITDHNALKYLWNNKDKTPRLLRALIRLQPYEIELYYKPGSQNHAADLLSRQKEMMVVSESNAAAVTKKKKKTAAFSRRSKVEIEYDVEEILDKRIGNGGEGDLEYLVKWLGYDNSQNTWEPVRNLRNALNKVAEYEAKRQLQEQEQLVVSGEKDKDDIDITSETIEKEKQITQHICNECSEQFPSSSSLYIHKYKQHAIPIPIPSRILGIVEENVQVLKGMQSRESEFKIIREFIENKSIPDNATFGERLFLKSYAFAYNDDDILFCVDLPSSRTRSRVRTRMRMCVPKPLRLNILKEIHEGILSSHPGVVHMYDKLREYVWWPSMLSDVVLYVKTCNKCQQQRKRVKLAPSLPVTIPHGPWQHVGVDITGPFPVTSRGNQYILVIMDHFTRWAEAFAIADQTTETIANILLSNIICRYGLFRRIVSDRGSSFVSKLSAHIYLLLGIKHVTTTAYHPQSNGIVERFNGTLKVTLSMWVNEQHGDWDLLLPFALFAYNVSVHRILHESPFYLTYGRDAKLPIDYIVTTTTSSEDVGSDNVQEYASAMIKRLKDVHQRVTDILNSINEDREKDLQNKTITDIVVGDQVWLYNQKGEIGKSRKLIRRWLGPYIVVEQKSPVNYLIEKDDKRQVVHVNRLKKAYTDDSTSLQSYSQQLEAAQQELDSISQAQQDMITRHMEVKDKISQLQALAESHTDKIQSCGTSVLSSEQTVPDNAEVEDSTYAVDMVELWEL